MSSWTSYCLHDIQESALETSWRSFGAIMENFPSLCVFYARRKALWKKINMIWITSSSLRYNLLRPLYYFYWNLRFCLSPSLSVLILYFSPFILWNTFLNFYFSRAVNEMEVNPGLRYTVRSMGLSSKNKIFAASATKWCWTWDSRSHPGPLQKVITLSNVRSKQGGILIRGRKCSRPPFLTESLVIPVWKVNGLNGKENLIHLAPSRTTPSIPASLECC